MKGVIFLLLSDDMFLFLAVSPPSRFGSFSVFGKVNLTRCQYKKDIQKATKMVVSGC